jgi:hypothetical protein
LRLNAGRGDVQAGIDLTFSKMTPWAANAEPAQWLRFAAG